MFVCSFSCVCVCVFHFWLNGASQLTFSLLKKFPCRPQEFSSFELPAAWRGKLSFFFWMEEISRFELHALLAHSVVHINICLIRHFSYFISCSWKTSSGKKELDDGITGGAWTMLSQDIFCISVHPRKYSSLIDINWSQKINWIRYKYDSIIINEHGMSGNSIGI